MKTTLKRIAFQPLIGFDGLPLLEVKVIGDNEMYATATVSSSSFQNAKLGYQELLPMLEDELFGFDLLDQQRIDSRLLELSGPSFSSRISPDILRAISIAVNKISAAAHNIEPFRWIGGISVSGLPLPAIPFLLLSGENSSLVRVCVTPRQSENLVEWYKIVSKIVLSLPEILPLPREDRKFFADPIWEIREKDTTVFESLSQAFLSEGKIFGKDLFFLLHSPDNESISFVNSQKEGNFLIQDLSVLDQNSVLSRQSYTRVQPELFSTLTEIMNFVHQEMIRGRKTIFDLSFQRDSDPFFTDLAIGLKAAYIQTGSIGGGAICSLNRLLTLKSFFHKESEFN